MFLLPWTWVSLHSCSSKAQPLLLNLAEGCLLTATPPDLERGVVPLGPLVPTQPPLLGRGLLLSAATPDLGRRVAPLGRHPWPRKWESSSVPLLHCAAWCFSHHPWPWARGSSERPCFCTVHSAPDGQHQNQIDHILCSQRWISSIQSAKTRPRTDSGSDNSTLLPDSDLNWRK